MKKIKLNFELEAESGNLIIGTSADLRILSDELMRGGYSVAGQYQHYENGNLTDKFNINVPNREFTDSTKTAHYAFRNVLGKAKSKVKEFFTWLAKVLDIIDE